MSDNLQSVILYFADFFVLVYTARHFLFTSMPPFHRTPGAHGSKRQAKWVHAWNYALEDMITSLARDVQKFPEAEMRLFNWTGLFNEVRSLYASAGADD